LEWKVLYVGSAQDSHQDQVLDEILVGPVPVGLNKFVLQADAPIVDKLPKDEILGVTVVLVTCSYKEREFVRIGYYVNNEYMDQNPEDEPRPFDISLLDKVQRQILADKPRVTKFPIPWGKEPVTIANEAPVNNKEMLLEKLQGTPDTAATAGTMDMED
jgi:histone chaperone ASF1